MDARRNVPRGIINSIVWSMIFGFVMACSFILAMPDPVKAAADGGAVILNLLAALPVNGALKDVLYVGIVLANYLCALAGVTSTSRMIYAFSRDGGLPGSRVLRQVSATHRSPVAAIWATAILAIAATLYSPAFAALAAGSAMFLYSSYAMPVAAGLLAEGRSWTEFGPFRLGLLSKPLALITLLGGLAIIYIGTRPPNDILDNYFIGPADRRHRGRGTGRADRRRGKRRRRSGVSAVMSNNLKFYIGGAWVDPVAPNRIPVINPATEEAFTEIFGGAAADVDKAVAAAKAAFPAFAAPRKSSGWSC